MRKCLTTVCFISLLLLFGVVNACASTTYGFETASISENEVNQIWKNISVRTASYSEFSNSNGLPIVSFDVSENGMILLGLKENKIAVLNEKNDIVRFFEFSNDGSYYVQWKDNNILLLLVRGSIVVEFSQDGQFVNMIRVADDSIENNSLWNQIAKNKSIDIGQSSYRAKNDMGVFNCFASSYSQLVCVDNQGNQTILYDVNKEQMTKTVVIFIGAIIFIAIAVSVIVFHFLRLRKQ